MTVASRTTSDSHTILFEGRRVKFSLRESATAQQCRVRIGPAGVSVIVPVGSTPNKGWQFLKSNAAWVLNQLERVSRLPKVKKQSANEFILRGKRTLVTIERAQVRRGGNLVVHTPGQLSILIGKRGADPKRTMENWLREEARSAISEAIEKYRTKIRREPKKVLVMGQRTKWGNCSSLGNLSFNWRLVMAPPEVLEYVVAHELTHLAIPDHTDRFWMTLRSICPESPSASKWLKDNGERLMSWHQ